MTTQEHVAARQRLAGPVGAAAGVLAAFAVVAVVDPHQGHYPVCPTLSLFGIYCPLCGGLRAANDLTHADVLAAAGSNLLFVAALPFAVLAWVVWFKDRVRGSMRDVWTPTNRQLWIAGGVLVAFMVVRNLPFGAALAP